MKSAGQKVLIPVPRRIRKGVLPAVVFDDHAVVDEDRVSSISAKPTSCVMHLIVIATRASVSVTSSTSLVHSRSGAEIRWLNSIVIGYVDSARAMAILSGVGSSAARAARALDKLGMCREGGVVPRVNLSAP